VERWRRAGSEEDVKGRRLFVQRREGNSPMLLLLHGFPSSSYDWHHLLVS
jgi:pimeloyl-ACP methyl ester carboxylesterase